MPAGSTPSGRSDDLRALAVWAPTSWGCDPAPEGVDDLGRPVAVRSSPVEVAAEVGTDEQVGDEVDVDVARQLVAGLPPLDDAADGVVDGPPGDGAPALQQFGMVGLLG